MYSGLALIQIPRTLALRMLHPTLGLIETSEVRLFFKKRMWRQGHIQPQP